MTADVRYCWTLPKAAEVRSKTRILNKGSSLTPKSCSSSAWPSFCSVEDFGLAEDIWSGRTSAQVLSLPKRHPYESKSQTYSLEHSPHSHPQYQRWNSSKLFFRRTIWYGTKSIWTPTQDTPYSNYGMPRNITSAEKRPSPERSPRKRYSKWSGGCNTSHEPAHPTTSSYSIWADHNASKPP